MTADGNWTGNHAYTDRIMQIVQSMDVGRRSWSRVNFDSEVSCFYGYAYCEEDANELARIAQRVHEEGPICTHENQRVGEHDFHFYCVDCGEHLGR